MMTEQLPPFVEETHDIPQFVLERAQVVNGT